MTAGEALVERERLEGEREGVVTGERCMFLKLLSARFGSLPVFARPEPAPGA